MENITGNVTGNRNYQITQNRELSWLKFNQRVLDEAGDSTVPLLERFKFISIFTSNLDEFFMVRVGSLYDISIINPDDVDNKTGMSPEVILNSVFKSVTPLLRLRDKYYREVLDALANKGLKDIDYSGLDSKHQKQLRQYFEQFVEPKLSPQVVDSRRPFPNLENKSICIYVELINKKGNRLDGILQIPSSLPNIVPIKGHPGSYIRIENLILPFLQELFPIYSIEAVRIFSITRNADISFYEEKFGDEETDYRQYMKKLLKKRKSLNPVRLEIQGSKNENIKSQFSRLLKIKPSQVYFCECPLNMKYAFSLESLIPKEVAAELLYPHFEPKLYSWYKGSENMFQTIRRKDRLLFYPFDSMRPFLDLLKAAADDDYVTSIKITIYRLAPNSRIASYLCMAAENGKDVSVIMELRARFDEQNNINWSEQLENSGCHIIYGPNGYKCHSKICLITRKVHGATEYFTQIGTGNYNEKTARQYTDLCLMTANYSIGIDAEKFFKDMWLGNLNGTYSNIWVSPKSMKKNIIDGLNREIAKGRQGYDVFKANSLTERDVIDQIAEASKAGVEIHMVLRSICCLRTGIPEETDNIEVKSIVGRFLEHSRIYRFGREDSTCELFISSADLMTRNLTRRVEVACRILDVDVKRQIIQILNTVLADDVNARILKNDGNYYKVRENGHCCSQKKFLDSTFQPEEKKSIILWVKKLFGFDS